MIKKLYILVILVNFLVIIAHSQEIVTGLYENPVIRQEIVRESVSPGIDKGLRVTGNFVVELPFFDDFSKSGPFPDPLKWTTRDTYVNTNFPYRSANLGAATFDAIDEHGNLHANASQFPFISDYLTSQKIRLDSVFQPIPHAITRADSIYFSFFYQPQGRGNPPEEWDSLILEFGYNTGNLIFAGYYDSITLPLSDYIFPGETILPGDTLFSPFPTCDSGLYIIANQIYNYEDSVKLPCDSVFMPEIKWSHIWASPGMKLDTFHTLYGTYCKQVIIPVLDSALFYRNDFQFRFYNYASLASDYNPSWKSNCDEWNVDYIYLNTGRSAKDTTYRDVSFVERAPSVLKNYESMPYNQYINDPTNEMKGSLELYITNLDTNTFNTSYYYQVNQVGSAFQFLHPGGNCNLYPFITNGYQNCVSCAAHACPNVNFIFPLDAPDSAEFVIRHFIIGDITGGDTLGGKIDFDQKFFNYYAYDDGSPEEGYGLTPAGAMLAYRFKLNVRDTLRAVRMYFNHTYQNANQKLFNLMVWRDNNGVPGDAVYVQANMLVEYSENLNDFHTYMLTDPVPVNGIFYIGWQQLTADNLNLGFDTYNDAQLQTYYNVSGQWYQSTFQGALMMRPVLGRKFSPEGIGENENIAAEFLIYPNPVTGNEISFKIGDRFKDAAESGRLSVMISNMLGQTLFNGPYMTSMDVSALVKGVYIARLSDNKTRDMRTARFIKSR
jgi:hypothetical protein